MEDSKRTQSEPRDAGALLAHTGWMRSLAASLVRDPAGADDLVQDAFVAALERRRGAETSRRGWLSGVLRNLALVRFRSAERRRRRETLAARRESTPSAADIVERAELHRRIVEAVLRLEEPYLSAILLRYFDGLRPVDIARARKVPESTVRTWLARGHEKLRRSLEPREGKQREAWRSGLLGLAGLEAVGVPSRSAGASVALGGAIVKTQVVVLSSLLACAALIAIAVWARGSQTHAPSSRIPEPLVSNPTREEDAKSELEAARRERERLLGRVAGLEAELRTLREKADAKAEPRAGEGTEPPPVAIQNAMRSWAALIADPERVWDHLHNTGDIESMEEFTRTVGTLVPWKLENEEVSGDERAKLERLLDLNGFRQGYVKFAKGDLAAAEEALEAHIERLDEKEATLAADGLKLDPAAMVYREMRSKDVLRFLRERAERLPALELDLGEGWIGEKRVLLGESRGKVVAVLFRRAGDARAGAFLAGLSREFAGKAGASLVTIGWFRTEDNIEEARAKLREDLAAIGYEGPAGVDPDPSGHSLFRGWQATVGSASFMIVDREGRLAWYMTDPKSSDLAIVSRILDRVEGRR